jgi:hypothetical protein
VEIQERLTDFRGYVSMVRLNAWGWRPAEQG